MLDLPSISPISLFGSSDISSVAFPPLPATSTASVSSLLEIARSTVEVSSGGRLLLAVALFQDGLEDLPVRTPDGNPIELTATAAAQGLVDAFNSLLGAVDNLPAGAGAVPGSSLVDQLVQAANELALQDIGIELQPVAIPEIAGAAAGADFRLRLDQSLLESALAVDATGTEARLTGAIESLRDLSTGFVAQVGGSVISLADSSLLETATGPQIDLNTAVDLPAAVSTLPADLLQQLPAATVVNGIPLSGLELALAGAAAGDIVAAGGNVTQDVLATTLLALNNATTLAATIETASEVDLLANTTTDNTNPLAVAVAADTGRGAAAGSSEQLLPAANPVLTTLPAGPGNAAATTPELDAFEASLALQRLLQNPAFHAIRNLDDPAYAALIAASHLSDFVAPIPVINADAIAADVPGPVSPVAMAHAIAYYSEAANEEFGRAMSRA